MKIDAAALAWAGGAIALPTLLRVVHPTGYVTAGQKAALAEFQNTNGLTLSPVVGDAVDHAVDATSLSIVADTVLAAAHAGAFVVVTNAQGGEAYNPLSTVQWFLGTTIDAPIGYPDLREATWQGLADTDDGGLSAFGSAVARVMRAKDGSDTAELGAACRALASAMDDIGLLEQAPADVTPLSWVAGKLKDWLLPSTTTLVIVGVVAVGGLYLAHKEGLL